MGWITGGGVNAAVQNEIAKGAYTTQAVILSGTYAFSTYRNNTVVFVGGTYVFTHDSAAEFTSWVGYSSTQLLGDCIWDFGTFSTVRYFDGGPEELADLDIASKQFKPLCTHQYHVQVVGTSTVHIRRLTSGAQDFRYFGADEAIDAGYNAPHLVCKEHSAAVEKLLLVSGGNTTNSTAHIVQFAVTGAVDGVLNATDLSMRLPDAEELDVVDSMITGTAIASTVVSNADRLFDGNTATSSWCAPDDEPDIKEIDASVLAFDLGTTQAITAVDLSMYYGDTRTYYNLGVLGYADGVWFNLIDLHSLVGNATLLAGTASARTENLTPGDRLYLSSAGVLRPLKAR